MGAKNTPTVRVDPELARISIGLHLASHFRLWIVGRSLTRDDNGSGKVSKRQLKAILRTLGVVYTRQHINSLFRAGEGLFWDTDRKHIYIRSWAFVAKQLTQHALDTNRDLLLNKPGTKDVLLSPAGSLEQWEATIYAGWFYHRDYPTIARETLQKLFNRTPETMRRWEQDHLSTTLTPIKNFAQTPFMNVVDVLRPEPLHSYVAKTDQGAQIRLMWQLPNTYKTKGIREHHHKGQASKVRSAVNEQLQQPDNQWRVGLPVAHLYFESAKRLRAYLKDHDGVFYLYRGRNRHKHGIFEATDTGHPETNAKERVAFGTERRMREKLFLSV